MAGTTFTHAAAAAFTGDERRFHRARPRPRIRQGALSRARRRSSVQRTAAARWRGRRRAGQRDAESHEVTASARARRRQRGGLRRGRQTRRDDVDIDNRVVGGAVRARAEIEDGGPGRRRHEGEGVALHLDNHMGRRRQAQHQRGIFVRGRRYVDGGVTSSVEAKVRRSPRTDGRWRPRRARRGSRSASPRGCSSPWPSLAKAGWSCRLPPSRLRGGGARGAPPRPREGARGHGASGGRALGGRARAAAGRRGASHGLAQRHVQEPGSPSSSFGEDPPGGRSWMPRHWGARARLHVVVRQMLKNITVEDCSPQVRGNRAGMAFVAVVRPWPGAGVRGSASRNHTPTVDLRPL